MPDRKTENDPHLRVKDYWCSYSLQQLSPAKFIRVVRNILNGNYKLLTPRKPPDGTKK